MTFKQSFNKKYLLNNFLMPPLGFIALWIQDEDEPSIDLNNL